MDIKLKSIKSKYSSFIIYILILILVSTIILSVFDIKDNLKYISPKDKFLRTDMYNEIDSYVRSAIDYALYYKSEDYIKNVNNITANDMDICRAEIEEKINSEIDDAINNLYNSNSFNDLEYDAREKRLEEEEQKVREKYNLTEEEFTAYIIERKINSYNNLSNELSSYKNLNFSAYDETTKKWIINEQNDIGSLKANGRFFETVNISPNGNVTVDMFVEGKAVKEKDLYNYYPYEYKYYDTETEVSTSYNYINNTAKNHDITIYVWMPKQIVKGDSIYSVWNDLISNRNRLLGNMLILSIALLMSAVILNILKKKKLDSLYINNILSKIKKYPIEYKVGAGILSWLVWLVSRHGYYYSGYISRLTVRGIISMSILLAIWYLIFKDLYSNYKDGTLLKNNISKKLWDNLQVLMKNGSIFRSILLMFLIYGAIGGILLFMAAVFWELFWIFFIAGIILTIVFIVVGLKKLAYLEKIMDGAKDGAEGRLTYKIEEKGQGRFTDLAHNINNMKEGLRESIQKEVKSERMKTELITNVSHDLKTPLTSIINYIDLLKRENIEPEEARDYINVLDNKAQRLKVLIEDLFEASKAASGAMELNVEKIEIVQLLKQVLGENDERISQNGLNLKVNTPEEKIYIKGDGKRLYRVFENLISNVIKYSLTNTRVYIDVIKEDENVKIVMKNIAAYELNFDVNEITERFKRADEARTSEGSGLGLAIAKSIVELHGGNFEIEIDGDLFKSIIVLKCD